MMYFKEIMELYHGTNIKFEQAKILVPNRALDFGAGFYVTSDKEQASGWAHTVVRRSESGRPLLNTYELDETNIGSLSVLKFEKPNKEWLDFVCANRLENLVGQDYDLIIGPIANDRTMPVLNAYMAAKNKDLYAPVALNDIRADRLTDQFVFKTEKSLSFLTLKDIVEL
jgi:hypothetical protein